MECYTKGAEGGSERSINLLTIAMKGVDSMLVGVISGGDNVLKCFEDSRCRF